MKRGLFVKEEVKWIYNNNNNHNKNKIILWYYLTLICFK